MRHSCCHCQRVDFVELAKATVACPGLKRLLTSTNDPYVRVQPLRGSLSIQYSGDVGMMRHKNTKCG